MNDAKAQKSFEARVSRLREIIKEQPEIGHNKAKEILKKEFGVGIDFYSFNAVKQKKSKPKEGHSVRANYAKKLLVEDPSITSTEVQNEVRAKFGSGIGNNLVTELRKKLGILPSNFAREVVHKVKAEMKAGTKPVDAKSPLRNELKNIGKLLSESGIESASMTLVDGIPRWRITETRTYEM